MKDEIYNIIFKIVDELNENYSGNLKIKKEFGSVLFGSGGSLDSLGLVNLIVGVEQNVEDKFGVTISIADERAMSQKSSPFRTIESLAAYVFKLLEEEGK